MRWSTFAIVTLLALVLQAGLRPLLGVPDALGVAPSFLLIEATFIGLLAPSATIAWAFLILGILADLQGGPVSGGVIVGPAAIGYLIGAYAVVQLRALVFRESAFTLAVMTFVVGVFVQLVIVALYTVRGVLPAGPIEGWTAADQLMDRFFELLYSAALALPVGFVLFRLLPLWGFPKVARSDRF